MRVYFNNTQLATNENAEWTRIIIQISYIPVTPDYNFFKNSCYYDLFEKKLNLDTQTHHDESIDMQWHMTINDVKKLNICDDVNIYSDVIWSYQFE